MVCLLLVQIVLSLLGLSQATTWASYYTYGSLNNCTSTYLLAVSAQAMGVCYQSSASTSFKMSCSTGSNLMKVGCTLYTESANCEGAPTNSSLCPSYSFPTGCLNGISATCDSNPAWLSWPGLAEYQNTSYSPSTCAEQAVATIIGWNPGCSEYDYGLYKWSREAAVVNDSLVINTYTAPRCQGYHTSQVEIQGLNSCHQKSVEIKGRRGLQAGASDTTYVYASSDLSNIPGVEYANSGSSSGSSGASSGKNLSAAAIAGIVVATIAAAAAVAVAAYRQRKASRDAARASESVQSPLIDS